jgi:hypothetical protein
MRMRLVVLMAVLALAACGPSTQSSDDVPADDGALPFGAIVAVGENWHASADPNVRGVSLYVEDGTEAAGVWSPPTSENGRHRLVADDITIELEEMACEMNGIPFPMRAHVSIPGRTLTGCASLRWDYQLIALMPQIDACIAQSPTTRMVSYAGETAPGDVLVRLQGAEPMMDCHVRDGVANVTVRNETLPMASEGDALFVRAGADGGANPGGECYEAPEVRGANNELLGWKLDPMGC